MGKRKGLVSKSSVEKLEGLHRKMINKGISLSKALKFTPQEWKKTFGGKKTLSKRNLEGQKRNLRQIKLHTKQVLKFKFKREGISDKEYRNFLRKRTDELLKVPTKKKGMPKKRKGLDLRINGYVHDQEKSYSIHSYDDLEDFLRELHKHSVQTNGGQYSGKAKMIVPEEEIKRAKKELKIYSNFDYGGKINF